MAIEVELKARILDPEPLRQRLTQECGAPQIVTRKDQYYRRESDERDLLRIREEDGTNIITCKQKKILDGVEQNEEYQFTVDRINDFLEFLDILEFYPSYRKEKFVQVFKMGTLIYEITGIPTLGWFIEIETVVQVQAQVEDARKRVLDALKSLDISEEDIEARSYKEMLGIPAQD